MGMIKKIKEWKKLSRGLRDNKKSKLPPLTRAGKIILFFKIKIKKCKIQIPAIVDLT